MTNKELCLSLMRADTEDRVIKLLKDRGYWDEVKYWRWYGGRENNYKDAGNQASDPDAALVEKITNSRDARLMGACKEKGVDPEGSNAPKTMEEAVALFFSRHPKDLSAGRLKNWTSKQRTEIARGTTLALTGNKPSEGYPSISIVDDGEGQAPKKVPNTILSIGENTKMRIPFVQGKFNMGGTACLRFCGHHNLQLVITKRNPKLLENEERTENDENWGFTIVRRLYPKGNIASTTIEENKTRNSIYLFLAPNNHGNSYEEGDILNFNSNTLPIFPDKNRPYSREAGSGTLIKLFEYRTKSKTHMFRDGGLLTPLDLLLPKIGLPVRLHECRNYKGHEGSFETTLTGLRVRLEDDKEKNLEVGFPDAGFINLDGNLFKLTIYAFKEGKARSYRKADKGVIFTVNGQTQGSFHERFFARTKKVNMNYIKDSIFVIVDCSNINWDAQEMLFMNNREHLSREDIRFKLEAELERIIREHPGLRALKERRRRERKAEKLGNSKALEKVLQKALKKHKAMAAFFSIGQRLGSPFKTQETGSQDKPYIGKRYPSYFKFKKIEYGKHLVRDCNINSRVRIPFETDAQNDYFDRNIDPGTFQILRIDNFGIESPMVNYTVNPFNGIATLNLELPSGSEIGDTLHIKTIVTDRTMILDGPFINEAHLQVLPEKTKIDKPTTPIRIKPPGGNGKDREEHTHFSLPVPTEVFKEPKNGSKGWADFDNFNANTALYILHAGEEDSDFGGYDFFINMDNLYLNQELSGNNVDIETAMEQYKIGMVLLGMSMIQSKAKASNNNCNSEIDSTIGEATTEDKVREFTSMVSPIIFTLINEIADIREDEEVLV